MSLLFFIIIAAGLPYLSAISYKNIKALEEETDKLHLSKTPIYLQSILLQLALLGLAYFTARNSELTIEIKSNFTILTIGASFLFLILALGIAWIGQKYSHQKEESTLHHLLPDNAKDRLLWIVACIVAAFCEEYIYRGVLFQLLFTQTVSLWIAAAGISAVIFAFGHGTQGEKAILQIIPFALGFHALVYICDGLLLPMIVHFLYNILVELLFGRKIKEDAG
jgi:membrane protease YdiL (CAAX protease family)